MNIIDQWTTGAWDPDPDALAWLRSRPTALHDLMQAFPPSAVVKAKEPFMLIIPAPGRYGIVTSWIEPTAGRPAGMVTVRDLLAEIEDSPHADMRAQCTPDALEVVAHWRGWTPERVRETLSH